MAGDARRRSPPSRAAVGLALAASLCGFGALPAIAAAGADDEPTRRCLALVAYAEAAGEGAAGMAAVIEVMRNRVADPRFPKHACAVAIQPGQFQPVGERPRLRDALANPKGADLVGALGGEGAVDRGTLEAAVALARARAGRPADRTGGALYFVNPDLMDPGNCPWFAGLKRTVRIGAHVFMTHYAPGERRAGPSLDCAKAGLGRAYAGGRGGLGVAAAMAPPVPALKPPPSGPARVRVELAGLVDRSVGGGTGGRPVAGSPDRRLEYRLEPGVDRRAMWSRPAP